VIKFISKSTINSTFDLLINKAHNMEMASLDWIGIRPARRESLVVLPEVNVIEDRGLEGDHYADQGGKRQVTLIRKEDLNTAFKTMGHSVVDPGLTRRNLVIVGLPHLPSKGKRVHVGEVVLEITGPCHPCSRMDENLGAGGCKALAGKGGLTARVIQGGTISLNDPVTVMD
jgi:MOSC domain-containing protein YiiM